MTKEEQEVYDRGYEQGRIQGRVEAETEKENVDGCVNCAYIDVPLWGMPCAKCKNNAKNYWRRRADE